MYCSGVERSEEEGRKRDEGVFNFSLNFGVEEKVDCEYM